MDRRPIERPPADDPPPDARPGRERASGCSDWPGRWRPAGLLRRPGPARRPFAASDGLHHPAKAKRVIFLFMNGAPSHVDTFDPKPALARYAGKEPPSRRVRG